MRKDLKKLEEMRLTFIGTVSRFSKKNGWAGPEQTIMLKDVKKDDKIITDHLWFNYGKQFKELNLKEGDVIQFDGRVKEYIKGYVNHHQYIDEREIDYKISHPTKMRKIN